MGLKMSNDLGTILEGGSFFDVFVSWLLRVVRGVVHVRERLDVRSSFRAHGSARKEKIFSFPSKGRAPVKERKKFRCPGEVRKKGNARGYSLPFF